MAPLRGRTIRFRSAPRRSRATQLKRRNGRRPYRRAVIKQPSGMQSLETHLVHIDDGYCRYGPGLSSCPAFAGYLQLRSANDGTALISSGFNPIAATTPDMVARLNSFPALRSKQGRSYFIYADPSGCGCAYVGTLAAMDRYRASFGALPADASSSGSFTNPEQNMIDSMKQDDAGAQFNRDVFGPD